MLTGGGPNNEQTRVRRLCGRGRALLARGASVLAAGPKYDLVVKGGRVIDPSVRLDAHRDVAIAGGRIAAVEPSIAADAAETLDARGKLVVPGLIDIHTHAARAKDGPPLCLQDGVTGLDRRGIAGRRSHRATRSPSRSRRRSRAAC